MVEEQRNTALADEFDAINAIYGHGTIQISLTVNLPATEAVLQLPNSPFSFTLVFQGDYPNSQPVVEGIHSVAQGQAKGDGTRAEGLLADALNRVFTPGQVCLFDLIEEASQALGQSDTELEDERSEQEADPTTCTAFDREGSHSESDANNDSKMYAALIRTHHITSRKKVVTLKARAKEIGCAALLRSGGTPGVMYVESPKESNVQKWVDTVHGLRYKDYQLVSPTAVVHERAVTGVIFDFEEVETLKDFGAKMQEKGIIDWWRRAMGYVSG